LAKIIVNVANDDLLIGAIVLALTATVKGLYQALFLHGLL
jgi:hypothetical protein